MRTPVVVALSGYGFAERCCMRVLEVVVLRSAESWGWPHGDLLCSVIAATGGIGAYLMAEADKKRGWVPGGGTLERPGTGPV